MKAKSVLFPTYGMRELSLLYGPAWKALIDDLTARSMADPHTIAFSLMCRRLARQHDALHAYSYERLCAICMADILSASHIDEEHILALYEQTLYETLCSLQTMKRGQPTDDCKNGNRNDPPHYHTKESPMFGISEVLLGAAVVLTLGIAGSAAIISVLLWAIRHNEERVIHD